MWAEELLGVLQHALGRAQQLQGHGGGLHLLAGAHQQRIAGELAQPPQLRADGGLCAGQPDGGARDAAFVDHRVQDPDEVKLDGVESGSHRYVF